MIWIVLGLVVLGVVAWLLLRDRGDTTVAAHARPVASGVGGARARVPVHRTWGKQFTIPAGAQACQSAREFEGRCFASGKAPTLPLAGCANTNCHCRWEPVAERRSGVERRSGIERRPTLRFDLNASQRRTGIDRRAENSNPFASERD